jgi:SP family galactose:H+ symporter-like MFS transporter
MRTLFQNPYQAFILCFTSLGGILFGYCTAIVAVALEPVRQQFALTTLQQGFFTSMILLGALFSSLAAGKIADIFGRKIALGISAVLFVLGAVLSTIAPNFGFLIAGRFVSGLGVGVISSANPLFLGEISSSKHRTVYVSSYQFAITVGILLSYLCGFLDFSAGWRAMFALSAVPAVIQLVCLGAVEESPRWLAQRGKIAAAKKSFERFGLPQHERHILDAPIPSKKVSIPKQPWVWKVLCIGVLLSAFQQLSGVNAVIYYAPRIFQEAHFSTGSGTLGATVFLGILNVVATGCALTVISRVGRRTLLLLCFGLMAVALSTLSLAFIRQIASLDTIAITSLLAYVVLFAFGPGPLIWVVLSEIFPQRIRGVAVGIAIFINWTINYLITLFFLDLAQGIGMGGSFALFAGLCALAFVLIYFFLPETRNKTLEQIESELSHR